MNTILKTCLLVVAAVPMICSAQEGGCDAKRSSIEKEIANAQAQGNAKRVEGLKTALAEMNDNCTDEALRNKAQRKVTEAENKLSERQQELQKARHDGKDAKKIAERQRKVDEAQAELEKTRSEASP